MITVSITCSFNAQTLVTAQATMGFEAGQPVTTDAAALATDPWIAMYPG